MARPSVPSYVRDMFDYLDGQIVAAEMTFSVLPRTQGDVVRAVQYVREKGLRGGIRTDGEEEWRQCKTEGFTDELARIESLRNVLR